MWPPSLVPHLMWKPCCPSGSYFLPWWNLGTQGLALILEQNVSVPKTIIMGFNINSITAFLKRQLYNERWQSSTFPSLCCFSLLQRYLFHVSLWVYQSSLCCVLRSNHFYLFSNLSWKAFVRIRHTLSPLKLNFTPSSDILKQACGHPVYFCPLLNVSICPVINQCEHLRKKYLSYHSFVMHHASPLMCN